MLAGRELGLGHEHHSYVNKGSGGRGSLKGAAMTLGVDRSAWRQGVMGSGPVSASVFKGPRVWPGVAILMVCVVG